MLVIDDRENDILKHKILARMGELSKVKRLASADYIIGEVGIEAKEINDLYHSVLGHGRKRTIVGQLMDLQRSFERPMLVVYGSQLKPFIPGNRRPNRQDLAREISKMQRINRKFKMDFPIRFPKIQFMQLDTMDDFVEFLVNMHQQMRIRPGTTVAEPEESSRIKSRSGVDPRVAALSSIEGVTDRVAHDLLAHFGSLPRILRARTSQRALMEVGGIGRVKAKRILTLRDRYPDQPDRQAE